jgi:hypothetical protein
MNFPEFSEIPEIPKIPEMQKAINRLRLLVASIKGKEDEMDGLVRQFKRQLERAPRHAIHGGNPLETTLSIMGEIQERLDAAVTARAHLDMIKRQAENELEALNITGRVNDVKKELAQLKLGREAGQDVDLDRISELERFIEDASNRAARAITDEFDVPHL